MRPTVPGRRSTTLFAGKLLPFADSCDGTVCSSGLMSRMTREREKWEYRVVDTSDRDSLQEELTRLGADGWELVSSTAMFNTWMSKIVYMLFLKRPV